MDRRSLEPFVSLCAHIAMPYMIDGDEDETIYPMCPAEMYDSSCSEYVLSAIWDPTSGQVHVVTDKREYTFLPF